MAKITQVKIDKRSKEYRNSKKKQESEYIIPNEKIRQSMLDSHNSITHIPTLTVGTHSSILKELQKQVDKLTARVTQIETKVG